MWVRILAVTALSCLPTAATAQEAALQVAFEGSAVIASGVSPGGTVAWFSIWREFPDAFLTVSRIDETSVDDDRDGAVRLEVDRTVPQQSVWVAVDGATGAFAVAAPEGHTLRTGTFGPGAIRVGPGGSGDFLLQDDRYLQVLLVRPGTGAWGGPVGDGGASDEDGEANGRIVFPLERLEPLGDSPPLLPPVFKPGDLLVAIDVDSLDTTVARVSGAPQS